MKRLHYSGNQDCFLERSERSDNKKCRDINDWCDIGLRKDPVICQECRRIHRKSIQLLDIFCGKGESETETTPK
jgi:hypothetical protein